MSAPTAADPMNSENPLVGPRGSRTVVGMFGTVTFSPAVVSPLAVAVCPLVLTTGLDS
jgi:hypothetical protein